MSTRTDASQFHALAEYEKVDDAHAIDMRSVAHNLEPGHLVVLLTAWVNMSSGPRPAKEFAKLLEQSHRTLQSETIRFFKDVLLAYQPGTFVDQRNEGAADFCLGLQQAAKEGKLKTWWPLV